MSVVNDSCASDEDAESPSLADYYQRDGDIVRFLDPITKNRLIPTEIPECIQQDRISQIGFARLRQLTAGQGITVHLLLGMHGSAKHFDEIVDRHRGILSRASIIAIEADWTATRDSDGQFRDPEPVVTGDPGRQEFTNHQLKWLSQNDKIVLPCDIDGPKDKLRQRLLRLWDLTESESSGAGSLFSSEDQKTLATGIYHFVREWAMIGQLGYWLDRLAIQKQLPDEPIDIAFVVGSGHLPFVKKFNACNIPALNYPDPAPIARNREVFGEIFTSMVTTATMILPNRTLNLRN